MDLFGWINVLNLPRIRSHSVFLVELGSARIRLNIISQFIPVTHARWKDLDVECYPVHFAYEIHDAHLCDL